MRTLLSTVIFSLVVFAAINAEANSNQHQLPLEAFGSLPAVSQVKLAPDGQHLAMLRNESGNTFIMSVNLQSMEPKILAVTDNQKFKINWYQWAKNDTLLISARFPTKRYRVEVTETRLLKVNIKGDSELEPAFKARTSGLSDDHASQFQDNVVSLLPEDDEHFLLAVDADIPNLPSVYKLSLKHTGRQKLQQAKEDIHDWHADRQGRVRLGVGLDDTRVFYVHKNLQTDEWETLWEYQIFDAPDINILGFDKDPNILYIRALHNNRYAVFKVDLSKDKAHKELVYADPDYDIEGRLLYSYKTGDVIGVTHGEADNGRIYWDKSYQDFQKALDKVLPNASNIIVSMSNNERQYVLLSFIDDQPGIYYVGDRDTRQLEALSSQYPLLDENNLSGKVKVQYQAQDGLSIEAYLTYPRHITEQQPLPAIILPHGGPMARDYGGFDWLTEFLANRGYLVLQPNFRGSSGYGFDFEQASVQGWGKEMQRDLQDAADWLVAQKLALPERICLVGASYGGYAALMGVATQGDTFKCAASINGVTDLTMILRESRRYTNNKVVKKQLGENTKQLRATSPLHLAENIKAPVLLLHGEADRVVPVKHSREMAEELQDLKKNVRYVELPKGNHYLEIEENRLTVLRELEGFLNSYL
ncbi:S9 family peptidase [Bowmanella sp. Y26]|uniref:alpha/beta hydrolase family protein n=1 Tax=Bowmanella yangjiangensis TaxID=2811230 RepID=UPI001BDD4785|nr:S9 family peptidase [Bowmanella yangjiangensis]MBT1062508.1 S9 family peptidase [Bowmanella yangjiangensis]